MAKKRYWYDINNILNWTEQDFKEIIYDFMQNYITGYNPYPLSFISPDLLKIFNDSCNDIRLKRLKDAEDENSQS